MSPPTQRPGIEASRRPTGNGCLSQRPCELRQTKSGPAAVPKRPDTKPSGGERHLPRVGELLVSGDPSSTTVRTGPMTNRGVRGTPVHLRCPSGNELVRPRVFDTSVGDLVLAYPWAPLAHRVVHRGLRASPSGCENDTTGGGRSLSERPGGKSTPAEVRRPALRRPDLLRNSGRIGNRRQTGQLFTGARLTTPQE